MSAFQEAKLALVHITGLERDALHVYVGLLVFLGGCLIFGWKARQWKPWLLILLIALTGEALDLRDASVYGQTMDFAESAKDLINTLIAPTALLLVARFSEIFARDEGRPD